MEDAAAGNGFEDDPHAVGEGPEGSARDGLFFLCLDPDLGAAYLKGQGVCAFPAVVFFRRNHRAEEVGQVVVEQLLVLVQGVRSTGEFQLEVLQLVQEGISKIVEKPRFRSVGQSFAGEITHGLRIRSQVGTIQEVGGAAPDVIFAGRNVRGAVPYKRREHLLGIRELPGRDPAAVHLCQRGGKHTHGRVRILFGYRDGHGVLLVGAIVVASEGMDVYEPVRDAGILQIAFQAMPQDKLQLISKQV